MISFLAKFSIFSGILIFHFGLVQASPPPSFFVVRQWQNRLRDVKSVQIHSDIYFLSGGSQAFLFREVLFVDLDGRWMVSQLHSESGQKICEKKRFIKLDETLQMPGSNFLFFEKDEISLIAALKARGLPFKTEDAYFADRREPDKSEKEKPVSPHQNPNVKPIQNPWDGLRKFRLVKQESSGLMRQADQIWWVFGENFRTDPQSPFLAFLKDAFLPVKWVDRVGTSEPMVFNFSQYRFEKSFNYPGLIQIALRGPAPEFQETPFLKLEMKEMILNPKKSLQVRDSTCDQRTDDDIQKFYRYGR